MGAVRKLKHSVDRKTLGNIYLISIHPKLEYVSIIWHACTNQEANMLENVKLNAPKIVIGVKRVPSHDNIYKECSWPLLSERHEQEQLIQFCKMIHNDSPPYICQLVPLSVGNNVGNVNLCNKNKPHTICTIKVKCKKMLLT